ncbi:MAG TPA: hypothetical protein VEZ90_04525 [Blastocatellia bacterium]|nr:hypothetical protein [Blastocatellia bacterium]
MILVLVCTPAWILAGQNPDPSQVLVKAIENGQRVIDVLKNYECVRETKVEPIKPDLVIAGTYKRVSKLRRPSSEQIETVTELKSDLGDDYRVSGQFLERLARLYYFLIGSHTADTYEFNYVGRERIDELNTYVFDIKPKVHKLDSRSATRYLKGRIWIDGQDMEVVKVAGEIMPPAGPHRTARFETYFQNHGSYWFPAYSWADDDLPDGDAAYRAIIIIRYSQYKSAG